MRTLYETVDDLRSEKNVIGYVSQCWNVASFKLPMSYKIDYAMYRNSLLIGFAEVKCRTHIFGTFPTYIISLAKVLEAKRLGRETNTTPILIVSWTDKIGYMDFFSHHQIKQGGRSDRNDWQDQEPMCHFDLKHFKGIGKQT
tara:strand:+ start:818 stop:1243 length:426 start_codon:yes stop_codon:yes gene_type:complete